MKKPQLVTGARNAYVARMQIDLEPERYRETGRARLVRSILHKPVFMTISTLLGVWIAIALGVVSASKGFMRVPEWAVWTLYPSFAFGIAFLVFAVLNDEDRAELPQSSTEADQARSLAASRGREQGRSTPSHSSLSGAGK